MQTVNKMIVDIMTADHNDYIQNDCRLNDCRQMTERLETK